MYFSFDLRNISFVYFRQYLPNMNKTKNDDTPKVIIQLIPYFKSNNNKQKLQYQFLNEFSQILAKPYQ